MAEAAVSFAVGKLGDLLIQKVNFLRGVDKKVESLKEELRRMQRFLNDATERQASREAVRGWISDIRQVALDAEDVIENFILKVDNPRRSRGLLERCACFPNQVYRLYWLGQELKSIERRLKEIDASRQRLGIKTDEGTSSSRRLNDVVQQRRLFPWRTVKEVVGLAEDVDVLIGKLVREEREGRSVASIVGMGGLGKTTLARKVYSHAAVGERFECSAWINVSNDLRPRDVIKQLVVELLGTKSEETLKELEMVEKTPDECLPNIVAQRLQGKRYFIVLDDVWRQEHCEYLERLFPAESDKASRILVTSRSKTILRGTGYVHEMNALDENKSWQLFIKVAFGDSNGGNCPPQLENIAKEILKKCNGLPLAIIVMGGLLLEQGQSDRGWERVFKRMNSYMTRNENSVSAVLELSYHDLPPYLKSCFLCLSFFREDVPIRATKLVQIWIAEGFVPREEGEETMEEKAWSYLDELINRNMVQVKDLTKNARRVKICQVHDLLRDLSIKKAKEEIKFEMLREGNNSESSNKFRHCAVYRNDERIGNPHLRSLFFYESDSILSNYWKSFGLLRILDMEGLGLEILPESIGSLIGLRYLGLRHNTIKKLPRSLGQLKNLQVLDLRGNFFIEVPNVICKLYSLRHLYMPVDVICKTRLKLDTLKNLRTLRGIHTSDIMVEHLSQWASLRKLEIAFSDGDFNGWDWLISLQHLVKLRIEGPRVAELPSAEKFPPNLSYLILARTFLREDPMPVLEKLPKLAYLELSRRAYDGVEMEISHGGFPSLRALCLDGTDNLRSMIVGNGGMPVLKRLDILTCPSPEILPEGEELRLMSNLQELKIWRPSPEFASKLIGEYSSIISNIPSVEIIP